MSRLRCEFLREPPVRRQARLGNVSLRGGGRNRAARLGEMAAVAEATLTQERPEFAERERSFLRRQVMQAEFLQSGRIDEIATIEMIELRMRRGVPAGATCRLIPLCRTPESGCGFG